MLRPLKIYVVGASTEIIKQFLGDGIDIINGPVQNTQLDFLEISQADAVFAISRHAHPTGVGVLGGPVADPNYSYRELSTKIGYALGIKRSVIVLTPAVLDNVEPWCVHHPEIVRVGSLTEGIQELKKIKPGDRAD